MPKHRKILKELNHIEEHLSGIIFSADLALGLVRTAKERELRTIRKTDKEATNE